MPMLTFLGQLLTFLSVVLGFIYQFIKAERQHKWDVEQRRETRDQLIASTQVTKDEVIVRAEAVKQQTAESEARLSTQIAENTDISTKAFKEANDVNNKIHALGLAKQLQHEDIAVIADFVAPTDKT